MAQVYLCDRCKALVGDYLEVTEVRGHDLCASCVVSLDAWLATTLKPGGTTRGKAKARRNAPEACMAVVGVIVAAQGKVSAQAFSEATGEPYRASYLRLRHLCRKGLIERVAGCVYRLPSKTMEAAE